MNKSQMVFVVMAKIRRTLDTAGVDLEGDGGNANGQTAD